MPSCPSQQRQRKAPLDTLHLISTMGKKRPNETEEERKERKRAKKEAKKKARKEKGAQSAETLHSASEKPLSSATRATAVSPTPLNNTNHEESPFLQKRLKMMVSLHPVALDNVLLHVRESLCSLLLKYSDGIEGILLGFDKVKFSSDQSGGRIMNELPQIHYTVELDALVFCPQVGNKVSMSVWMLTDEAVSSSLIKTHHSIQLTGVVNECFPSHVGMLVHSFFNAMVSSDHMHSAGYVFDGESQQWIQENGDKVLGNDDKVGFVIEKIHECDGIISMEGSHPTVLG